MTRLVAAPAETKSRDSLISGEFAMTTRDFREIAAMLYADAGIYLQESKATLVYSRLVKRLRKLNLENFQDYCQLVASPQGAAERLEMLSALTTNVTRFFREPHHFDHLRAQVLPPMLEAARRGGRVRLWSAACSTGQEPYSIALTLLSLEPNAASLDVKILATDIDPRVVAEAQRGVYPESALAEVPADLRRRYFEPTQQGWQAVEAMRRLIAFRTLNLNADWPMAGKFGAIFCRNVVIYFDEPTQQAVWSRFADKLEPNGWLYIGHSERVTGPATARFVSEGVTAYRLKSGGRA
ncbi:MAG: protein-glutamate O-methyltransferase CheR [Hyphomicrobiales bacterium]|nr:protein-glutamate O-methyltransferase CheR [Hyphomicrobiales bacterium]